MAPVWLSCLTVKVCCQGARKASMFSAAASIPVKHLEYTYDVERGERALKRSQRFQPARGHNGNVICACGGELGLKLDFSWKMQVKCYNACCYYIGYTNLLGTELCCRLYPPTACPQLEVISPSRCLVSLKLRSQEVKGFVEAARSWIELKQRSSFAPACA